MSTAFDTLSDDQARKAAKLLFDLLPASLWKDGDKPSAERVRTVIAGLREEASLQDQPALEGLVAAEDPGQNAAQAAVARLVLQQAAQNPAMRPYSDEAVATAAKPDMVIDPITGIFVVALLLCTTKITPTEHGYSVELGGGAKDIIKSLELPELLKQLPDVIKALPSSILARILPG